MVWDRGEVTVEHPMQFHSSLKSALLKMSCFPRSSHDISVSL